MQVPCVPAVLKVKEMRLGAAAINIFVIHKVCQRYS